MQTSAGKCLMLGTGDSDSSRADKAPPASPMSESRGAPPTRGEETHSIEAAAATGQNGALVTQRACDAGGR